MYFVNKLKDINADYKFEHGWDTILIKASKVTASFQILQRYHSFQIQHIDSHTPFDIWIKFNLARTMFCSDWEVLHDGKKIISPSMQV